MGGISEVASTELAESPGLTYSCEWGWGKTWISSVLCTCRRLPSGLLKCSLLVGTHYHLPFLSRHQSPHSGKERRGPCCVLCPGNICYTHASPSSFIYSFSSTRNALIPGLLLLILTNALSQLRCSLQGASPMCSRYFLLSAILIGLPCLHCLLTLSPVLDPYLLNGWTEHFIYLYIAFCSKGGCNTSEF